MCQSYTCTPSVAWAELGRQPLGPRHRLALARATSELPFIEQAIASVAKVRTKDDPPPTVDEVRAADEVGQLYAADLEATMEADDATVAEAE